MSEHPSPLFEFDPSPGAVINPSIHRALLGFPRHAVMCWFGNIVGRLVRSGGFVPARMHETPVVHETPGSIGLGDDEHRARAVERDRLAGCQVGGLAAL